MVTGAFGILALIVFFTLFPMKKPSGARSHWARTAGIAASLIAMCTIAVYIINRLS